MKRILLAAFAGVALLMTSCNKGGDPKAVLGQFFSALEKKDIAAARKLATTESKSMLDMMELGMKTDTKESEKYKAANMEIGEPKIEGDKATVPVKEKESGETMNYSLKKEGGSWKVAFDKASIMNMATEKMGEKGININDSIQNAIDEVQKLDTDSLANAMKEGAKALDSAGKALEELQKK
ncbi:MAG: DUF4878 domain-containing protein [Ferruginibacter sp.]